MLDTGVEYCVSVDGAVIGMAERRRPGRVEYDDPELLRLLREPASGNFQEWDNDWSDDAAEREPKRWFPAVVLASLAFWGIAMRLCLG
jgi:hypothetical protein